MQFRTTSSPRPAKWASMNGLNAVMMDASRFQPFTDNFDSHDAAPDYF